MIGLVDGNNFYVSCERVFDPSLAGKPVAVLSNNDGCVISRSYEFKALSIPMGTPCSRLRPLVERHGIVLRSSNYELYGDLSRRFIATLREFSPQVEPYSIDEAFVRLRLPPGGDYAALARRIRSTVLQWVGIPCGVGFAPSRTLAKIANHIGKKRLDGLFVMPDDPLPLLGKIPVGEVWGVGGRLAPKLAACGISTARALAEAPEALLRKRFGVNLARTSRELRGEQAIEPGDMEEASGSISCSRSFGRPVTRREEIGEAIAFYVARAAEKLRKSRRRAAGANVYLQAFPDRGAEDRAAGFAGTTVMFAIPTAATSGMISAISPKIDRIYLPSARYKKAGVVFFGLEPMDARQLDLFAGTARDEREEKLSSVADRMNDRFGKGTLFNLAEGIRRTWAMKRELLSPCYTTSWDHIPVVK